MGSNKKTPASAQIATALAYGNTQCSRRWQLAIAATGCVGCTTSPRRSIRQPRSTCGYRRRNAMPYKLSSGRRYLYGELLPGEMIETRLKDCSQDWISACQSAIAAAPEEFVDDLLSAISLAVRVERNRRANAPMPETERRQRSLFSSGLTWIPTGHTQRTWSNSGHQSGGAVRFTMCPEARSGVDSTKKRNPSYHVSYHGLALDTPCLHHLVWQRIVAVKIEAIRPDETESRRSAADLRK